MSEIPPASQFYYGDFLVDTAELTNTEEGVYIRLLCHAWKGPGIPADESRLARMVGETPDDFAGIWSSVKRFWQEGDDGRLYNRRQESIRREQQEYRQRQIDAGKRGAAKRWGKGRHSDPSGDPMATPVATPMAPQWPEDSPPPPPPPPTTTSTSSSHALRARETTIIDQAVALFIDGGWPHEDGKLDEYALRVELERLHDQIDLDALRVNITTYLASPRCVDQWPRYVTRADRWVAKNLKAPSAPPARKPSPYDNRPHHKVSKVGAA